MTTGIPIYHVTVTRYIEFGEGKEGREEPEPAHKFYGTVAVVNSPGNRPARITWLAVVGSRFGSVTSEGRRTASIPARSTGLRAGY